MFDKTMKSQPGVPDGWRPMPEYDHEHRMIIGLWVQKKIDGVLHWVWDVEVFDPFYGSELIWGEPHEYVGFRYLPSSVKVIGNGVNHAEN